MVTARLAAFTGLALLSLTAAVPAGAGPHMVKEVMDAGLPTPTCQYCHTSAMPTKETFKPADLNERGRWLVAEKDKQKAKAVKGQWLKNYPGGK